MTNSVIGALSVKITADADGVKEGVKAAGSALDIGAKKLRSSANQFGKWATAGVLAAGGITSALVKMNLTAIKELKNTAFAANVTVESFQRGAFAAEQFGISQEKYGDILKDVNDRVGDFLNTGAGPMVDFFERVAPKVGVTAEAFKGLSGQQALGLYVQSLQKANLSQQEMTFFMEAMASDSTRLIPLFKDNSKQLKEMSAQAKELGVGLSEIDVAKATLANKEMDKFHAFIDATQKSVTIELIPLLDQINLGFIDMAKNAGGTSKLIQKAISGVASAIGVFADGLNGISIIFQSLKVVGFGFVSAITSSLELLSTAIGKTIDGILFAVNKAIGAINTLTNSNIELVPTVSDSAFMKGIHDIGDNVRGMTAQATDDLQSAMMKPIPSASIDKFVSDSNKKFESMAVALTKATTPPKQQADKNQNKNNVLDSITPQTALFLKGLKDRFKSQAELESQSYAADLKRLRASYADKNNLTAEQQQTELDLLSAHTLKLQAIKDVATPPDTSIGVLEALGIQYETEESMLVDKLAREKDILQQNYDAGLLSKDDYEKGLLDIKTKSAEAERSITLASVKDGFAILASGSKKAQNLMKKVAIINAVIKGKEAAVSAWNAGMSTGGPFAPIVAASYAAASIAKTASMINSIKAGGSSMSSSIGSGGVSASSSSTSTTQSSNTAQQTAQPKAISINMTGSGLFSTDQVRELIGQINEASGDGVTILTTGA